MRERERRVRVRQADRQRETGRGRRDRADRKTRGGVENTSPVLDDSSVLSKAFPRIALLLLLYEAAKLWSDKTLKINSI